MSLANIAALLANEKAVKSTGFLKSAIEGINQAQDSGGLSEAKELFEKFTDLSPIMSLGQALVAEIQAETVDSTMTLFKEILTLIQNDSVGSFMSTVSGFLSRIIDNGADVVLIINKLEALTTDGEGGFFQRFFNSIEQYVFGPLEAVLDIFKNLADAAERIRDAITGPTGTTPDNAPAGSPQNGTVWDWIRYIWNQSVDKS